MKVPLISTGQLPMFYNLTQLKLFFTFKQTWHQKWEWILKLLQQSPKLQHLIIHEVGLIDNFTLLLLLLRLLLFLILLELF